MKPQSKANGTASTVPDLPELAGLPPEQRAQIWEQANRDAGHGWLAWLFVLFVVVTALMGGEMVRQVRLLGSNLWGDPIPEPLAKAHVPPPAAPVAARPAPVRRLRLRLDR